MMAARQSSHRPSAFSDYYRDLPIMAGVVGFVGAMVIAGIVSRFTEVTHSAWSVVANIAPWFVGVVSGIMVFSMIPMYISHGHTRKRAFRDWLATSTILVAITAVIIAIGFPLERAVYRLADFPGRPEPQYLFGDPDRPLRMVLQMLIVLAVWNAVGGMISAAVYRFKDWGWVTLGLGTLLLSFSGAWTDDGSGFLGFLRRVIKDFEYESTFVSVLIAIVCSGIAIAIAWLFTRDTPMRNP